MKKRLLFLFVLLFIVLQASLPSAPAAAAPAQQTNLLNNPGFEQPYSSGAANGWGRWHQETGGDISCEEPWAGRPDWTPETNTADLIHGGSVSQHVGVQYNKWHAGVMQNVSVTPGTTYRFTFWARGRAAEENYPAPSLGFINMNVQARIDPQGRGNWGAPGLAFGATGNPHDVWQQFSVEATATGDQITVFVAANFRDSTCARHMDVWFDDAQLVEVGPPPTDTPPPQPTAPPPPPAPAATNTPVPPTETPTPEVTPTNTPAPTETPTLTPTTPPGGTICVNAFADENANGQHEDNEGAMAGVTFTIASGGDVVAQGISSGPDPLCFEELEPGNYQVAQTVPNTLEMTTGGNTGVTVNEGQTIFVEFGSRARPGEVASGDTISPDTVSAETDETAEPAGVEAPEEGGFGSTLLAVSGLGAIFLAIIMLGVLIFLLLRQRT